MITRSLALAIFTTNAATPLIDVAQLDHLPNSLVPTRFEGALYGGLGVIGAKRVQPLPRAMLTAAHRRRRSGRLHRIFHLQ